MLFPWFVSMWLVGNVQSTITERTTTAYTTTSNKNNNNYRRSNYNYSGYSGNRLKEVFKWKQIDFMFPSKRARNEAIATKEYIPENNLPLGLEIFKDNIYISLPRWKKGVPFTLAVISKTDTDKSPLLRPFPKWTWHKVGNCNGLTSVFRMSVDSCGRMWVLDSGSIDLLESVRQICPAQIIVFDLYTGRDLMRYKIPKDQSPADSLFTNIVVDVRDGQCDDAFAYMGDVFRYGMLVYSMKKNKSWRIDHPHFFPDPIVSRYNLDGIVFRWTDGIFGLALSPLDQKTRDRTLYFHPLSSYREFSISTAVLRDENRAKLERDAYMVLGEPRGTVDSHAAGSAMDREGILYYNLVSQNAVGCWNSHNAPHFQGSQGLIEMNNVTLNFPNDMKVDQEAEQSIWILSNKLHKYLYGHLDPNVYNYHILTAKTKNAVRNTVCEPGTYIPMSKKVCYDEYFRR